MCRVQSFFSISKKQTQQDECRMKRLIAAMVIVLICFSCAIATADDKYKTMPEIFAVSVESAERKVDDNRSFVYKEYLKTTNL